MAPLKRAAAGDRRKEAAVVAAGDSQMGLETVCGTVVAVAKDRKAGEVVDHDVNEKWQP